MSSLANNLEKQSRQILKNPTKTHYDTGFRTLDKISLDYKPERNFRRSASQGDSLFNLMILSMSNSVGRNFSLSY
uniref:Uncharacterized protein n=1 Tax=Solanum tuberosum TaxID=4113 RepID=M1BCK5_SOLTU